MKVSLQQGSFLVKIARKAVEEYLKNERIIKLNQIDPIYRIKRGVFTTIESYNIRSGTVNKELRGCIGFPYPIDELINLTIKSAILAATEDPRFPPLEFNELDDVVFELSILTEPKLIEEDRKKIPSIIKIGRDGLIIERGLMSGLLLPQVAVENEWDAETFLCNACLKAGLPPDSWLLKGTKVYTFQAEIFAELEPKGRIIKRSLYRNDQ
jgi:uncharacterized protein (TIGR00296 family)